MSGGGSHPSRHRAAVITALAVESEAVRAHLADLDDKTGPEGTVYQVGSFTAGGRTWEVSVCEVGAHNVPAALATERAINQFDPQVILFVGVAGGVKDVKLGDVVAATKVYGYESGKDDWVFKPRPEVFRSTHRMEQRARAEAGKGDWLSRLRQSLSEDPPRVFVGPIASGRRSWSPPGPTFTASSGITTATPCQWRWRASAFFLPSSPTGRWRP